ncbi:MAG TPA: molybdopterin-synthase adenylyltransferase MoeB [Trueperaceae bacterium]
MFTRDQLDRYARHIILPGVGAAGQQKLLSARVLVVGAGGLGAPLLLYLAAAGVGTLGIVDDDAVELSNLQRQVIHGTGGLGAPKTASAASRLADLNPGVNLELHPQRLTSDNALTLLGSYDLVIDGSDNFPTRYLVNDACVLTGKPLLYGAMSQFEGQMSFFHAPGPDDGFGPCYRCLFPAPPAPGSVPNCAEAGVFGALPGVIGSLMAVEAIKWLAGLGESLSGRLLHYDALYSEFREVKLARNPDCPVCGIAPSITKLIDYQAFCGLA